jgi:hypothetical protein
VKKVQRERRTANHLEPTEGYLTLPHAITATASESRRLIAVTHLCTRGGRRITAALHLPLLGVFRYPVRPTKGDRLYLIALYCAVFGAFAFGFIRPLFSIANARHEPMRLVLLVTVTAISAVIVTLMIVRPSS